MSELRVFTDSASHSGAQNDAYNKVTNGYPSEALKNEALYIFTGTDHYNGTYSITKQPVIAATTAVAGVHTLTVTGAAVIGDKVAVTYNSETVTHTAAAAETTTEVASALATVLAANAKFAADFTIAASNNTVTFTQKVAGTGVIPTIVTTRVLTGTITASITTTTKGVAEAAAHNALSFSSTTDVFGTIKKYSLEKVLILHKEGTFQRYNWDFKSQFPAAYQPE